MRDWRSGRMARKSQGNLCRRNALRIIMIILALGNISGYFDIHRVFITTDITIWSATKVVIFGDQIGSDSFSLMWLWFSIVSLLSLIYLSIKNICSIRWAVYDMHWELNSISKVLSCRLLTIASPKFLVFTSFSLVIAQRQMYKVCCRIQCVRYVFMMMMMMMISRDKTWTEKIRRIWRFD